MSRLLHVDAIGGAAGDMLLAALLDAGAPLERVAEAVSAVLGRDVELGTTEVRRGGLRALALELPEWVADPARRRRPLELLEAVGRASLGDRVHDLATPVLQRLVEAEARVHGLAVEELELEELGEDDTLVDVVGIAAALDALGVERLSVSSLPLPPPSGDAAHGSPGAATLELLRGFEIRPSVTGELSETVTPTAAAVLAALGEPAEEMPAMTVERIGYGAGVRDPSGVPNVVRVLVGSPARPTAAGDRGLLVLEANVDDLSPELVPDAIEALLSAGALDAWATPVHMKKGRPGLTVSALCEPDVRGEVQRAFFEATSTFGLRVHEVARPELERRIVEVDVAEGGPRVRMKLGLLDGRVVSVKPEHDDVVEAAGKLGRPVREVHEQASALAHRVLEGER